MKYQNHELLVCLIKEAQQLGIVVMKTTGFLKTSHQSLILPYCKADFLKILFKKLSFKLKKHYKGNLFKVMNGFCQKLRANVIVNGGSMKAWSKQEMPTLISLLNIFLEISAHAIQYLKKMKIVIKYHL